MSRELMSRLLILETAAGECVHPQSAIDERRALASAFENGAQILNGIAATLRSEASEMAGSRHSYDEAVEAYVDAAEELEIDRDTAMEVVDRRMQTLATIVGPGTEAAKAIVVPAFDLPAEILAHMPTTSAHALGAIAETAQAPRRSRSTSATPAASEIESTEVVVKPAAAEVARPQDASVVAPSSAERPSTVTDTEIEAVVVAGGADPIDGQETLEALIVSDVEAANASTDLFEADVGSSAPSDDESIEAAIPETIEAAGTSAPISTQEPEVDLGEQSASIDSERATKTSEPVEPVDAADAPPASTESTTATEAEPSREPDVAQASATPVGARRPGRMPPFVKR